MSTGGVSVIIPALNECESIGHVVGSMPWHLIQECIVVDNGSTDGTAEVARAAGARVVTSQRGYGAACAAGAKAALESSSTLVFMDGDGSDVVEDMPRFLAPIQGDSADFVIGSRIRGTIEPGSMLMSQKFAGRFVGLLLRMTMRARYTDMGPFRAIRRSALQELKMSELTYGWNLEMQIKAVQHKLRIVELPVNYRNRIGGVSKVSGDLRASAKAATRILGVFLRVGLLRKS